MKDREHPTPSVSSQRRGTPRTGALLCSFLTLAAILGAASLFLLRSSGDASAKAEAPAAPPPMPVEVAEVVIMDAESEIGVVGSLRSNESVVVTAEIAGRIDRIAFAEGQKVARGDALFFLDDSVLRAEFDRAEAARALSEANYRRAEALLKDRAVSERERDEAYAQWQLDEASVRLAKAQLDKTRIAAPFGGTLGLRQVSAGDYIAPGQPLVNLEDVAKLKVEFRVPEKYSAQAKVGQKVTLRSESYPGRDFAGTVYAIDPQVEQSSRSLVIRGLLDNADGALRPGQFVKVALAVANRADALFIPEQALITQPKATLVFKVVDGAAQMAAVEIGARRKGWVEIVSGLAPGDVVVTGGHQKIGPGSPVHTIPADPALFAKM